MTILSDLIRRVEYTDWANRRTLESIRLLTSPPPSALAIMSHLVLSQITLFDRTQQRSARRGFWETCTLDELTGLITASTTEWREFLVASSETTLTQGIPYVTSKGDSFVSSVLEITTHMVNHSSYHRGQIALLVRQSGGEPAMTDYLVYARGR